MFQSNEILIFNILTSMKSNQLSLYQKQQYAIYLQNQLQKFSAFMLAQKKQNAQLIQHSRLISHHSQLLQKIQSQVQLTQLYQQELLKNGDHLSKRQQQIADIDIRLLRLEDRINCQEHTYFRQKPQKKQDRQCKSTLLKLSQKLKSVEQKINHIQMQPLTDCQLDYVEQHTLHKVKKLQKKMKKYFSTRFEHLEQLIQRPKKIRKSKSPSRTPAEMSTMSRYQVETPGQPLSQFRLEDLSIKYQQSTNIRDSHNSNICSRVQKTGKSKVKETKKKKQRSKSHKKMKNNRGRSRSIDESKSVSRKRSISLGGSISDNSVSHSCCSRSPSILPRKANKLSKSKRSISHSLSKSYRSGVSLHQKCKKKPLNQAATAKSRKIPSKSRKTVSKK